MLTHFHSGQLHFLHTTQHNSHYSQTTQQNFIFTSQHSPQSHFSHTTPHNPTRPTYHSQQLADISPHGVLAGIAVPLYIHYVHYIRTLAQKWLLQSPQPNLRVGSCSSPDSFISNIMRFVACFIPISVRKLPYYF